MTEAYLASGTEVLEVNHLTQLHLREVCPLRCNTLIIIGLPRFKSLKLIVSHLDEDRLVLSRHARRERNAAGSVHVIPGFEDEGTIDVAGESVTTADNLESMEFISAPPALTAGKNNSLGLVDTVEFRPVFHKIEGIVHHACLIAEENSAGLILPHSSHDNSDSIVRHPHIAFSENRNGLLLHRRLYPHLLHVMLTVKKRGCDHPRRSPVVEVGYRIKPAALVSLIGIVMVFTHGRVIPVIRESSERKRGKIIRQYSVHTTPLSHHQHFLPYIPPCQDFCVSGLAVQLSIFLATRTKLSAKQILVAFPCHILIWKRLVSSNP